MMFSSLHEKLGAAVKGCPQFVVMSVAVLLSSFPAMARTVYIASQSESAITLGFGDHSHDGFVAVGGAGYELFVAHGAVDADDDKYAWTDFERVDSIANDQTSYTYEVPAALRDGGFIKFFLLQKIGIDMTQELDGVKATGAQVVKTGIYPKNYPTLVVDFRLGDIDFGNADPYRFPTFFGQWYGADSYLFTQQSGDFKFFGSGTSLGPVDKTASYRFVINNENTVVLFSNGVEQACVNVSRSLGNWKNNEMMIFGDTEANRYAYCRFDRMKIGTADKVSTIQRDFIPALKNGVAGLYDNVYDKFYPSTTTTALVAGAERPVDRFGRVISTSVAVRCRRTLTITSLTSVGATLAVGNTGPATKLFIGYGATDGGGNKHAWDHFAELATISGDQTTVTVTFPQDFGLGMFYRFFLMKTEDLPYTAELESLTSTGQQCVRIGYIPGNETETDFRFGNVNLSNESFATLFGQAVSGYAYFLHLQSNPPSGYRRHFCFLGDADWMEALADNADYRVQIFNNKSLVIRHGSLINQYLLHSLDACPINEIGIFSTWGKASGAKFRFDSLVFSEHGIPVRDLVPVVSNGKGALFDRVGGTVYGNLTSTDFTYGTTFSDRLGWVQAETETRRMLSSDRVATAVWTGGGDRANATDAANWLCQNALGGTIPDAVPTSDTYLYPGETGTFNLTADGGYNGNTVVFPARITLTADCDWSALDISALGETAVDLNGHTLRLAAKTTQNQSLDVEGAGTLVVTVAEGATYALCGAPSASFADAVQLVKEGAGTFVIHRDLKAIAGITVKTGMMCSDKAGALKDSVSIKVEEGATFDVSVGVASASVEVAGKIVKSGTGNVALQGLFTGNSALTVTGGILSVTPEVSSSIGKVNVAAGAVLDLTAAVPVKGLEVDASGAGSVNALELAFGGVIDIVNAPADDFQKASEVDYSVPLTIGELSGTTSGWRVRINGVDRAGLRLKKNDNALCILANVFVLFIR